MIIGNIPKYDEEPLTLEYAVRHTLMAYNDMEFDEMGNMISVVLFKNDTLLCMKDIQDWKQNGYLAMGNQVYIPKEAFSKVSPVFSPVFLIIHDNQCNILHKVNS